MFDFATNVGANTFTIVYHSNSFGDEWSTVPDSIVDFDSYALNAPDDMNAWIVGKNGKIYKGVRISTGIYNETKDEIEISISLLFSSL